MQFLRRISENVCRNLDSNNKSSKLAIKTSLSQANKWPMNVTEWISTFQQESADSNSAIQNWSTIQKLSKTSYIRDVDYLPHNFSMEAISS